MGRHRSRIVALQAIVVSVLVVIVVVTLLKPEDSGLLSGVTSPGVPESGLPSPGAYIPSSGEHRARHERDHGPAGRRHRPATGALGGLGGGATVPAPVFGAAPSPPAAAAPGAQGRSDDGEGSPADDQYADTLTRITERLN